MSRVASIAIVHETLSQAFDEIVEFDRVADELLRMVGDVAASWGYPVAFVVMAASYLGAAALVGLVPARPSEGAAGR